MKSNHIKACIFIVNFIYTSAVFYLFIYGIIQIEFFISLLFFQVLVMGILLFNYFLFRKYHRLAASLGFHYETGFFDQPRMEGIYRKNWWELHFKQMERGEVTGMLRTYVKLQWKKDKRFDEKKLKKYANTEFKGNRIISVEHIVRPYKNYLLLRKAWFTFDKEMLHELMDHLLKIAKESEIR